MISRARQRWSCVALFALPLLAAAETRARGQELPAPNQLPVASATVAPPIEVEWVRFEAPRLTADESPHGGPDWRFSTPRLPAVSAQRDALLVADTEVLLGGVPNLTLRVLRIADGHELAVYPVLDAAEFNAAARGEANELPGDKAKARRFCQLAQRVRSRVAALQAQLASAEWRAMASCRVNDVGAATQSACAMEKQAIECPGLTLSFAHAVLTGRWHARSFRVTRREFRPAPRHESSFGTIAVRACWSEAWFDADASVFVGRLRNECQSGGDWCIVQPRWVGVQLKR